MNIGEAIKGERLKNTIPKTHAYKYNYNDSCTDQSVLAGAILRMCIHGTFYVDLRVEKRGF